MFEDAKMVPFTNISGMEQDLLDDQGRLKTVPCSVYEKYSHSQIQGFCHKHAFYLLPTTELINWLKGFTKPIGGKMIEVGAGNGALGRAMGIHMTDAYTQEKPDARLMYQAMGQPTIKYGRDVKKMDAEKAVKKYRPSIVLASWLTQKCYEYEEPGTGNMYGPREEVLLKHCKYYIMVGNEAVHRTKRILRDGTKYEIYRMPIIQSRASQPEADCVYVFKGKKR